MRGPNRYAPPPTRRAQRKWDPIITAFMEDRMEDLMSIQRTGARGRIFAHLITEVFRLLEIPCQPEPIFDLCDPNPWYVEFADKNKLKLRTHSYYNPDFFFDDGTWVEVTLSENCAYQKLFRYGHQAPRLTVIWLGEDTGLHKEVCERVVFPNAEVKDVASFYPQLAQCADGEGLIGRLRLLKTLKGQLL